MLVSRDKQRTCDRVKNSNVKKSRQVVCHERFCELFQKGTAVTFGILPGDTG